MLGMKLPALRALQVLSIDAVVMLRLNLSAAMRTGGVRKRPNLFQFGVRTARHLLGALPFSVLAPHGLDRALRFNTN